MTKLGFMLHSKSISDPSSDIGSYRSDPSSDIGSYPLTRKAIQIYFKRFIKFKMLEMISNETIYWKYSVSQKSYWNYTKKNKPQNMASAHAQKSCHITMIQELKIISSVKHVLHYCKSQLGLAT